MEAGKTWGYVSMKPKWGRWEWKHSEMNVRHLAYRHINRPLPSNSQLLTTLDYRVATGSLKQGKEVTGKHVYRDESVTERPSFYDRNMISAKAKRKRASLTQRTAPKRPTFASIVDGWQQGVEPYAELNKEWDRMTHELKNNSR
jgi:hypothetical protein